MKGATLLLQAILAQNQTRDFEAGNYNQKPSDCRFVQDGVYRRQENVNTRDRGAIDICFIAFGFEITKGSFSYNFKTNSLQEGLNSG